jgi:hypothetical protein
LINRGHRYNHACQQAAKILDIMKTVLLFFVLTFSGVAQTTKEWNVKISLNVTADDEPIRNRIISYCSRELRSIKGITIVASTDEHTGYTLEIVAITSNGIVAVSGVVASPLRPWVKSLDEKVPDMGFRLIMKSNLTDAVMPLTHVLMMRNIDHLDELCKALIGDIDGGIFQTNRKLMEGVAK